MKKGLRNLCVGAMCSLMLLTSGCFNKGITEAEGKAWAEKNGYVKETQTSVVGTYIFEYILFDSQEGTDMRLNSCSVLNSIQTNESVENVKETCREAAAIRVEITDDGKFKVVEPGETTTWNYLINEKGELLVSPLETNVQNSAIAGVYYNMLGYALENGRVYLKSLNFNDGIDVVRVYKKIN